MPQGEIRFFDEDEEGISTRTQDMLMDGNPAEEAKIPDSYAGQTMPSKLEEAAELAKRLGVAIEELPDKIMEMKQALDDRIKQTQRFIDQFKTRPTNRAMRRAQKYQHSRLHY